MYSLSTSLLVFICYFWLLSTTYTEAKTNRQKNFIITLPLSYLSFWRDSAIGSEVIRVGTWIYMGLIWVTKQSWAAGFSHCGDC